MVATTTTASSAPKLLLRRCMRTHVKISVYVKQILMATFKESTYPRWWTNPELSVVILLSFKKVATSVRYGQGCRYIPERENDVFADNR
jgi:hypothetical protein